MAISTSDIIRQNTLGLSEGFPAGVPTSYNWYQGWNPDGMGAPPSDFTAVTGWGVVYQEVGAPESSNPNATVEVANAQTYVHLASTGQWVLAQDQATDPINGGHFVTDFAGDAGIAMNVSAGSDGSTVLDAPTSGYNDHFWPSARGTYAPGTVDGVYVQMDMRVTDPNSNLVASVGADWWHDANADWVQDFSNNPGAGSSNWVQLSTQWSTVGFYSESTPDFQGDLPPPLVGSAQANPPPVIAPVTPDTSTASNTTSATSPSTPDTATAPPVSGANHLVNGSFEASTLSPLSGSGGHWGGTLYDNAGLVAAGKAGAVQQSAVSQKPMDLVTQYSAASFADSGVCLGGPLHQRDLSASLPQTLAKSH
jgi:hypothetical protein